MPRPRRYAIYPAVGIARLGSGDQIRSYIGPDFPDPDFAPFTIPGIVPKPYRDPAGNIRRQAARFRVYRVEWRRAGGRGGWVPRRAREVTATGGVTLKWTVTVANFKAFKAPWPPDTPANKDSPNRIPNRASAQVTGVSQPSKDLIGGATIPAATFPSGATKADLLLGQIETDDKGRLIFYAGIGECRNVGGVPLALSGLFHRGWFDDVCDGSVECEVDDGTHPPERAERAWIVTGAPAYAHQIGHIVTLYDAAETIAISKRQLPRPARPSIVRHIYPVLRTTELQRWVTDFVDSRHTQPFNPEGLLRQPGKPGALPAAAHRARRVEIVGRLRNPRTLHVASGRKNPFLPHWYPVVNGVVQNNPDVALDAATTHPEPSEMPLQIGLPFTLEQWKRFRQWRNGDVNWDYHTPADIPKPPVRLEDITDGREQVDALNRAHLGAMIGGSTMPGIEVGWKALETKSWGHAFRPSDSLEPGDLTFSLSVPWPTDFLACSRESVTHRGQTVENDWWPAARPLEVFSAGAQVDWDRGVPPRDPDWWKTRGFIAKNAAGDYEEVEKP